jgi:hypothetical protein
MLNLNRYDIRVEYDPPPIPTWERYAYKAWSNEFPEEFGIEHAPTAGEAVGALVDRIEAWESK